MNPQGTSIINPQYFSNLVAQIDAINVCADLQTLATTVMADLQAAKNAIEAEIAKLLPGQSLLTMSISDLGSVISFLTNFQSNVLALILGPYTTLVAQLTQLLSQIESVVSAISAAEARIASCTISIAAIV
jgi:prefoldin subunit 5